MAAEVAAAAAAKDEGEGVVDCSAAQGTQTCGGAALQQATSVYEHNSLCPQAVAGLGRFYSRTDTPHLSDPWGGPIHNTQFGNRLHLRPAFEQARRHRSISGKSQDRCVQIPWTQVSV